MQKDQPFVQHIYDILKQIGIVGLLQMLIVIKTREQAIIANSIILQRLLYLTLLNYMRNGTLKLIISTWKFDNIEELLRVHWLTGSQVTDTIVKATVELHCY
jgi:hypothetical protein